MNDSIRGSVDEWHRMKFLSHHSGYSDLSVQVVLHPLANACIQLHWVMDLSLGYCGAHSLGP